MFYRGIRSRKWLLKLLAFTLVVWICVGCNDPEWTVSYTEKRIGVKFPPNATNLTIQASDAPGDELVYIEFDLPLYEGDDFSAHFCSGELEQGMNPFVRGYWNPAKEIYEFDEPVTDQEFGMYCDGYPIIRLLVDRRSGTMDEIALQVWFP